MTRRDLRTAAYAVAGPVMGFEAGRETADSGVHAWVPEMGLEHDRWEHIFVGFRGARIARYSGSDGPYHLPFESLQRIHNLSNGSS